MALSSIITNLKKKFLYIVFIPSFFNFLYAGEFSHSQNKYLMKDIKTVVAKKIHKNFKEKIRFYNRHIYSIESFLKIAQASQISQKNLNYIKKTIKKYPKLKLRPFKFKNHIAYIKFGHLTLSLSPADFYSQIFWINKTPIKYAGIKSFEKLFPNPCVAPDTTP